MLDSHWPFGILPKTPYLSRSLVCVFTPLVSSVESENAGQDAIHLHSSPVPRKGGSHKARQ